MTKKTKTQKRCIKCEQYKTTDNFTSHLTTKDRLSSTCKVCHARYQKVRRKNNPERERKQQREWRAQNADRVKATKRATILKRDYGLTVDDFEAIKRFQNNCCAICTHELKRSNVDHNHATGETRGLLCWHCNNALGKFRDNPTLLQRAAEYLLNPIPEQALGSKRYGLPGRITTQRKRRQSLAKKTGLPLEVYKVCWPEALGTAAPQIN